MSVAAEQTHTLADLADWSFAGVALAVVGRPVAHSLSPEMHNAALADLARDRVRYQDWRYFKFDVPPEDLPRALRLFHAKKFHGLNLTVPHKTLAVDLLESHDDFVLSAGAANTLSRTATGWRGNNTDGIGLALALRETLAAELAGADVILLGAGGAARGAAMQCLQAGCRSLWIGNRTRASLDELIRSLQSVASSASLRGFGLDDPAGLPAGAIVVNATSLGLKPGDASPVDLKKIHRPAGVYDMIYRPSPTALLRQAAELGLPRADGLSMLIHQGARSLEIWTGTSAPLRVMQQAARAALGPN